MSAAKKTAQVGEQRPVRRPERSTAHLATGQGDLVTEHDHLDRQFVAITPGEPEDLERSDEGQVQEAECHPSASSLTSATRKGQLDGVG